MILTMQVYRIFPDTMGENSTNFDLKTIYG